MSHNLIAIHHLQIGQVILRAKNSFGYVFKQIVRKVSENVNRLIKKKSIKPLSRECIQPIIMLGEAYFSHS